MPPPTRCGPRPSVITARPELRWRWPACRSAPAARWPYGPGWTGRGSSRAPNSELQRDPVGRSGWTAADPIVVRPLGPPVRGGPAGLAEAVADRAHGLDQVRVFLAQLCPKPPDVDVDGAGAAVVLVAPDPIEQRLPGDP